MQWDGARVAGESSEGCERGGAGKRRRPYRDAAVVVDGGRKPSSALRPAISEANRDGRGRTNPWLVGSHDRLDLVAVQDQGRPRICRRLRKSVIV